MRITLLVALLTTLVLPTMGAWPVPTLPAPPVPGLPPGYEELLDKAQGLATGKFILDANGFLQQLEVDGCARIGDIPPIPGMPIDYTCSDLLDFVVPTPCEVSNLNATEYAQCMAQKFCVDFNFTGLASLNVATISHGVELRGFPGLFQAPGQRSPGFGAGIYTLTTETNGNLECNIIDETP